MDAEAVGAALTPAALAPPIADSLGLSEDAVIAALELLARGAQPAFLARYRPERTLQLSISDLERIQALALRAVAFEFNRQELASELKHRRLDVPHVLAHLRAAENVVDLDDVRSLLKRRKRGPAAKARAAGLASVARALWLHAAPSAITELLAPAAPERDRETEASTAEGGDASDDAAVEHFEPIASEGELAGEDEGRELLHDDDASQALAIDDGGVSLEGPAEAEPAEADEPTGVDAGPVEASSVSEPTESLEEASEPEAIAAPIDVAAVVESITSDGIGDYPTALAGARAICAEQMSEFPLLRVRLRERLLESALLTSTVVPEKKDKAARFAKFFDHREPCKQASAATVLALHRGEREGFLRVDLEIEPEQVIEVIVTELAIDTDKPAGEELLRAAEEAWEHGLGKVVRAGVRKLLKRRADSEAIVEFCEALRPLLLAPALGPRGVLAIDPGHQNGCRLAALDGSGRLLAHDTVFPLQPKLQVPQARARIVELCQEHGLEAIVVAASAAGREVERLCRELVREDEGLARANVQITSIDADAAALYASSRIAKEELPDGDAALRRAVSAGRRVQDPLLELVKIDPRKLGLGQHQHEVDQEELRKALEQVIVSSVSEVTVDVNTVSPELLTWVAGMSHALAKAVIGQRGFRSRAELHEVPGFAGKAFEQAAGFLRIHGSEQRLDETRIHPERYAQVTEMARDLGVTVGDLLGNAELVARIDREKFLGKPGVSGEPLGPLSFDLVVDELQHPARDPRPPFRTVEFHPDLKDFGDLRVGMDLDGIVTRLAGFGAFIDVGIAQEALVHVSELSHDFISTPLEAVHVGQAVRGRVIEISPERKRFSLSLKALLPKPERAPRPEGKAGRRRKAKGDAAPPPKAGGGGKGKPGGKGPGGPRGGDDRGDRGDRRKPDKERTLGFRLDLSDLAQRLEKR